MATQMELARQGKVTEAMAYVAEAEGVPPEEVREKVAAGVAVIPANPHHRTLTRYTGIGKGLSVKVNANLGTSYDYVNPEEELEKLRLALCAGADAVMDLSTGGDLPAIRKAILERCPVPLGTLPIYEAEFEAARKRGSFFHMTVDDLFATIERHGREGVDFITVHCGVTRQALARYMRTERVTGIVSRGGGLIAAWMLHNEAESPSTSTTTACWRSPEPTT